jgi:hypothetical protein
MIFKKEASHNQSIAQNQVKPKKNMAVLRLEKDIQSY